MNQGCIMDEVWRLSTSGQSGMSLKGQTRRPANSGIFSAFQIKEESLKKFNTNKKCVKICKTALKLKKFQFFLLKTTVFLFWKKKMSLAKNYHLRRILRQLLREITK